MRALRNGIKMPAGLGAIKNENSLCPPLKKPVNPWAVRQKVHMDNEGATCAFGSNTGSNDSRSAVRMENNSFLFFYPTTEWKRLANPTKKIGNNSYISFF